MADVTYRFAGIPYGIEASVEDVTAPGVEIDTVTGTQGGYADLALPVGDYVAIYTNLGETHRVAGDLAAPTDTDYARSGTAATGTSSAFDGTTIGTSAMVGAEIVVTYSSVWGINSGDEAYYDADGAAPGEAAVLHIDTTTGAVVVTKPEGANAP